MQAAFRQIHLSLLSEFYYLNSECRLDSWNPSMKIAVVILLKYFDGRETCNTPVSENEKTVWRHKNAKLRNYRIG